MAGYRRVFANLSLHASGCDSRLGTIDQLLKDVYWPVMRQNLRQQIDQEWFKPHDPLLELAKAARQVERAEVRREKRRRRKSAKRRRR